MKQGEIRKFILFYTSFSDTSLISEKDLVRAVNDKFHLSYQLNRFQDIYIDKMGENFKKWKGRDGYWIYERTDANPDPEWTLSRCEELEEYFEEGKFYTENENFLTYLEYARRHGDVEFENHILEEKLNEVYEKLLKSKAAS